MKKLDWYIVKKFIGTFFYAIMILAVIACVIDYSEKVDDFVSHKAPAIQILLYFKNFIPHITALLFPLFIFIATIFFTSKLAYKSEIIAMLATGVSFQRFLRPYLIGGGFLCLLSLVSNHFIVPNANKQRLRFEDTYVHNKIYSSDRNIHLRLSPDLYVYMLYYDYVANTGYFFTAETIEGTDLKKKISADHVNYDSIKHEWKLFTVKIRHNNGLQESLRQIPDTIMKFPFKPSDLEDDEEVKAALTTPELNNYIAREKLRGRESLNFYYVEKYRRSSEPFAGLILTLIGVCIASKKVRGGSGLHLAIGIIISALYIMAMQFSTTFSTKAGLNPLLAVWIPNIIFGGIAYYMYRKQIK
ncbi:MAG: LptF/LptG family permease [Bacteroidetes bacterium]|nr:LptF/LptG family permease [Bacteroidota bacterium]